MPIYFIAFVSHIALLYFSVKIPNKRVSFLLAVIAVLPLCLVAGLRDASVGTGISSQVFLRLAVLFAHRCYGCLLRSRAAIRNSLLDPGETDW